MTARIAFRDGGREYVDDTMTIQDLRRRVAAFVAARDWEQFHTPKDLAAAISIEAAELQEIFLWKTGGDVAALSGQPGALQCVRDELADVIILSLTLANRLDIDVAAAVSHKLDANAVKYPIELARGRADKYTAYDGCNGISRAAATSTNP